MISKVRQLELAKVNIKDIRDKDGNVVDTEPEMLSRKYILIMNVNVIDILDNKYKTEDKNGFEVWAERTQSDTEHQYELLADFLCTCVNEGIKIENKHRRETNLPELEYFKTEELNLDIQSMFEVTSDMLKTQKGNEEGKN